jgi:DNA-binding response OmpR family regulator
MSTSRLKGKTVLVLEDEYLTAEALYDGLTVAGAAVAGPFSDSDSALGWLRQSNSVDAAILDVRLRGQTCFAVADFLAPRQVPLVFTTALDPDAVIERFSTYPLVLKPVGMHDLLEALEHAMATVSPRQTDLPG